MLRPPNTAISRVFESISLGHKSTKVHVALPQVVLIDFHGTISERKWEDKVVFPYVRRAVSTFIRENWDEDSIQKCLPGLKNESFEQRFRHKYDDAPIIDDQLDGEETDPTVLATQVSDFLAWQMTTKRETRETQTIVKLIWQDGFRRRQILTPLYEDVFPCIKLWHEQYGLGVFIISSIDDETLKLLFENTDRGNMHQYISGYVSSKKMGDKLMSDTYRQFFEKQLPRHRKMSAKVKPGSNGKRANSSSLNRSQSGIPKSPWMAHLNSQTCELLTKPVLFLTDSGQEARAASEVNGGTAFDCILVSRAENKKLRTYYLSQFQYVNRLDDIEFVQ